MSTIRELALGSSSSRSPPQPLPCELISPSSPRHTLTLKLLFDVLKSVLFRQAGMPINTALMFNPDSEECFRLEMSTGIGEDR